MKRIIALVLAILTLWCLVACGSTVDNDGKGNGTAEVPAPESEHTADALPGADVQTDNGEAGNDDAGNDSLTGKLVFIDPDGDEVIRGVSISGNRSGTAEFNSKEPAAEGIRCVFELSEYVGVTPDTDETQIKLYVFEHRVLDFYKEELVEDREKGCVTVFDLERDEDGYWGEFYLNPDEEPGYYDFVFAVENKAVASLLTRFYPMGELEGKTDAELEKLMKG